jgi:phosphoribosylformylglycinamidine synthase
MVYFFKLYSIEKDFDDKTFEYCYYVESNKKKDSITEKEWNILFNLISNTDLNLVFSNSILEKCNDINNIIEFGPNLSITTAWSSNANDIIRKSGIYCFKRIEKSHRTTDKDYLNKVFDKMTQVIYDKPLVSFKVEDNKFNSQANEVLYSLPLAISPRHIREYSKIYGLGFLEADILYYYKFFSDKLKRKPNTAELIMLSQLNSEHSRHRFFTGEYDVLKFNMSTTEANKLDDIKYCRTLCCQYIQENPKESLLDILKQQYYCNLNNEVIAFSDNASAIKGHNLVQINQCWSPILETTNFQPDSDDEVSKYSHNTNVFMANRKMAPMKRIYHPTIKCETHNFPTAIVPFEGAATGVGGRIRDIIAIGRGGYMIAGIAGYSVGNINPNENMPLPKEVINSPLNILIKASDGASDYGNKIGEPIILGFTRSFGQILKYREIVPSNTPTGNGYLTFNVYHRIDRKEYLKPIMFSGGIGFVDDNHTQKKCKPALSIIQVGGPAYRIGIYGSSVSSTEQNNNDAINYSAVQRGDPHMESKLVKFVNSCLQLGINNPILSIHGQGAGGPANVISKICRPNGCIVYLQGIDRGDDSMSDMEVLLSEYQEQVAILIHAHDLNLVKILANRENVPINNIGTIIEDDHMTALSTVKINNKDDYSNYIDMYMSDDDTEEINCEKFIKLIDLPINRLQNDLPKIKYNLTEIPKKWELNFWYHKLEESKFATILSDILRHVSVGSKRFLTSKVDRSVGQVSQQQTIGFNQVPLSDYAIIANNFFGTRELSIDGNLTFPGTVTAIGEQPIKGIYDIEKMVRLTVAEMLTNLIWAGIEDFTMIRCSANWMWANQSENGKYLLYRAVKSLTETLEKLNISIIGGKDSLSMSVKTNTHTINSPNTLVLTGYVTSLDIRQKVNAGFVKDNNHIIYVNLSHKNNRLGGSILSEVTNNMSGVNEDEIPDFETIEKFPELFEYIQYHIKAGNIIAGHDVSDGGLISTIIEMTFPNNKGCKIMFNGLTKNNCYNTFMTEEPGLVIEYKYDCNHELFIDGLNNIGYHQVYRIGNVGYVDTHGNSKIQVDYKNYSLLDCNISQARIAWEESAQKIETIQIGKKLADEELNTIANSYQNDDLYHITPKITERISNIKDLNLFDLMLKRKTDDIFSPKVAILREDGSNGDREMKAAFMLAGFQTYDIHINDLISSKITLNDFMGIVFVGGFSYGDTFGAAQGWYSVIVNNEDIKEQFDNFYKRNNTFSFGVCNGCQLMSLLGWVPFNSRFVKNDSKRFESRYSIVKITKNNSIMLKDMENMSFGIWSAHAEGKYQSEYINELYKNNMLKDNQDILEIFPVRYLDNNGQITETYPHNPNGSIMGIASIVSENGRHLAMMPHPERTFMGWQQAYCPTLLKQYTTEISPWFIMFRNAYNWCQQYIDHKIASKQQEIYNIENYEEFYM